MEIQTNIKHHNRHPRCAHDSREERGHSLIWTLRSSGADFHPLTRQDHAQKVDLCVHVKWSRLHFHHARRLLCMVSSLHHLGSGQAQTISTEMYAR